MILRVQLRAPASRLSFIQEYRSPIGQQRRLVKHATYRSRSEAAAGALEWGLFEWAVVGEPSHLASPLALASPRIVICWASRRTELASDCPDTMDKELEWFSEWRYRGTRFGRVGHTGRSKRGCQHGETSTCRRLFTTRTAGFVLGWRARRIAQPVVQGVRQG